MAPTVAFCWPRRARGGAAASSYPFALLNSNKESITLNIKSADAQALIKRMAAELDTLVAQWTSQYTRAQLLERMQQHGVISASVQNLQEVIDDPHLAARGTLVERAHPGFGSIKQMHTPLRFRDIDPPKLTDPPALGAATEAVLAELAGVDAAEFARLKDEQAI